MPVLGLAALLLHATDSAVNVQDYGALGDGKHNDGPSILNAVTANPTRSIRFPSGDYLIDNSAGYLILLNFAGVLDFDAHARILCNTGSNGCLQLSGGTGARLNHIRVGYASAPTARTFGVALSIYQTTDTLIEGAVIEASPSAGILSDQSIRPHVSHAMVSGTLADGIHFANCQDAKVSDSTTLNTGDDGVAFVNYAAGANYTGGQANNITVRNSKSRGISVVGQSDVVITNFLVDTTSSSGALCAYDASYNTRVPDRVRFSHGVIKNAGTLSPSVGNRYGVEFGGAAGCAFDDIAISGSADRSFAGSAAAGEITINNVSTSGGTSGFNIGPTKLLIMTNVSAESSSDAGFFISMCGTALLDSVKTINVAQGQSALHRAIWFENNTYFRAHGLSVIDLQTPATGYIVGEFNNTNGVATGIQSQISHGNFTVQQNSSHVLFSREDAP